MYQKLTLFEKIHSRAQAGKIALNATPLLSAEPEALVANEIAAVEANVIKEEVAATVKPKRGRKKASTKTPKAEIANAVEAMMNDDLDDNPELLTAAAKSDSKKDKTTFGIKDSAIYKFGTWGLTLASSSMGLVSNIEAAYDILKHRQNAPNQPDQYSTYYEREHSYAITANRFQPFMNIRANPMFSSVRFGMPFFY